MASMLGKILDVGAGADLRLLKLAVPLLLLIELGLRLLDWCNGAKR